MARARTQKTSSERGPLLALFVLFADGAAAAELFRMVRWHGGVFCPDCGLNNIAKYVAYSAIAKDGRQLFRTRELFDAPTFV